MEQQPERYCSKCARFAPRLYSCCGHFLPSILAKHPEKIAEWTRRYEKAHQRFESERRKIIQEAKRVYSDDRAFPIPRMDWNGQIGFYLSETELDVRLDKQEAREIALKKFRKNKENKLKMQLYELKQQIRNNSNG